MKRSNGQRLAFAFNCLLVYFNCSSQLNKMRLNVYIHMQMRWWSMYECWSIWFNFCVRFLLTTLPTLPTHHYSSLFIFTSIDSHKHQEWIILIGREYISRLTISFASQLQFILRDCINGVCITGFWFSSDQYRLHRSVYRTDDAKNK